MSVASLYREVLDTRFDLLDDPVRRFHSLTGTHSLRGRCSIQGAEHAVGKVICLLLRLPRPCPDAEFSFLLEVTPDHESWTRRFPRRAMRSTLRHAPDEKLEERIGPARLRFSLGVSDGELSMHLDSIHVFGLAWPRRWFPEVWATERGDEGRFHFDVGTRFRKLGLLVAYSGHLEMPAGVAAS